MSNVIKFCKFCNKEIKRNDNKFCNLVCFHEYKFLNKTKISVENGLCNSTVTLRNYLIRVFGNFCFVCKQSNIWQNKKLTLQVDHIDGNSDNNFPSNLRLLCPNCHTQTPTYNTRQKKFCKRNRYLRKFKGYGSD